jgi:hypothetical protein
MINTVFNKRVIVGHQLQPLVELLNLSAVFTVRDIGICEEIYTLKNN